MISQERKHFNEAILPGFVKDFIEEGNLVIDVGRPDEGWGYREIVNEVPGVVYKTLDKRADLDPAPDIVDDMENTTLEIASVDRIICWATVEQCDNPFKLVDGIWKVLKPGGYALFGILSIGYPLWQDLDLCRFTPQGVRHLLKGFRHELCDTTKRDGVPSCIFTVVKR